MDRQRWQLIVLLVVGFALFGVDMYTRAKRGASDAAKAKIAAVQQKAQDSHLASPTGPATKGAGTGLTPAERTRLTQVGSIETADFRATATNLRAAVSSFRLKGDRYQADGHPLDLVTTDREEYEPLGIEIGGLNIPSDAIWKMEQLSPTSLRFTWEGDGFQVVRKLEAGRGRYQIWSTITIANFTKESHPIRVNIDNFHYVKSKEEGSGFLGSMRRSPALSKAICRHDDTVLRKARKELEHPQRYAHASFTGVENTYFTTVIAAENPGDAEACIIDSAARGGTPSVPDGTLFHARLVYPRTDIAAGEAKTFRSLAYFGPKTPEALGHAGHSLTSVVDLGIFSVIGRRLVDLLRVIHDLPFLGNWGLAIIVLTIIVRLVMIPLTYTQLKGMARMRALKPELDRINVMYGDDREKKGAATMELYRKHGINPVSGCLPTLGQLPVWIAFYTSLSTNMELFHTPFFGWLTDLSAPDPYFVLPVLYAGIMIVQQKITPNTGMDPAQAQMMQWMMPGMMLVFTLFLPQGLVVYMITNSVLGIAQQRFIEYRLKQSSASGPTIAPSATS